MSEFIKSWFVRPTDKSVETMFSLDNAPTTAEALRIQGIGDIISSRCSYRELPIETVVEAGKGTRFTVADGDWLAIGQ